VIPFGSTGDIPNDVVLQPDGKIVVIGSTEVEPMPPFETDFFVLRLDGNGSPDEGFGTAGKVIRTAIPDGSDFASKVAIDSQSRIVVAGSTNDFSAPSDPHVFVYRLNADGSPDSSFGTGGVATTPLTGSVHEGVRNGLALQPDGKIVVGADFNGGDFDWAVLRYLGDSADLGLIKTADPAETTVGSQVTYALSVTNAGPNSVGKVTVTDTLPAGAGFVSATPSQGTCSGTAEVVCDLGVVPVGGAGAEISLVVTASTAGSLVNSASVRGEAVEIDGADNESSAAVTVTAGSTTTGGAGDGGGGGCSLTRASHPLR
jgi:uncharacterized repeat protein (TIGR01451 family)/uncharacterized delta-60 repeat protein